MVNIEDHIDCLYSPTAPWVENLNIKLDDIIYLQINTRAFSSVFIGLYLNNVTVIRRESAIDTLFWTLNEYEY
jgi:hypothetical protein